MNPRTLILPAVVLLLLVFPAQLAAQPAAADLDLQQALPEEAFGLLGQRQGVIFQLAEGEAWIGPEARVRVTADLRELSFWEAVLELSAQTAYEPVFEPYGRAEDGKPILRLRRRDVKGEEEGVVRGVAAGPLLIRTRDAWFNVPLKLAQVRMVPIQTAVRTEVFLEPGVSAVYVTAAALRAQDEAGEDLRRGEGLDPTVRIENGIGELTLHFDVIKRIPKAIGRWQGLLRLVESEETQRLQAPLKVVAEERKADPSAPAAAAGEDKPAGSMPATRPGAADVIEFGPYRLGIEPLRVGDRQPSTQPAPSPAGGTVVPSKRVATLRLTLPRGPMDYTDWSRLYGFLVALPPALVVGEDASDAETASPWVLTGYAIVADAAADDPQTAGVFRVWAQYEASVGTPDPEWVTWELPVKSTERKLPVAWTQPVPISGDFRGGKPATEARPADSVPPADRP